MVCSPFARDMRIGALDLAPIHRIAVAPPAVTLYFSVAAALMISPSDRAAWLFVKNDNSLPNSSSLKSAMPHSGGKIGMCALVVGPESRTCLPDLSYRLINHTSGSLIIDRL